MKLTKAQAATKAAVEAAYARRVARGEASFVPLSDAELRVILAPLLRGLPERAR